MGDQCAGKTQGSFRALSYSGGRQALARTFGRLDGVAVPVPSPQTAWHIGFCPPPEVRFRPD